MDELNNQIIDECKDLKEEEFIYTINEFLEMYNEEKDNIYMLLEYNIWLSPINGNENIELNFDNGIDLYLNVSDDPDMYKNFEVHIYKMEYEKINDITENISDFIYSLDEEKQEIIGIYLTDYYLMCYKDINDVEDERYEYISFINNSNEEEILDKFHNDMDFRTVILEDYIHEIYQSYQDEKTNDIYTLSYYLRSNILKLVEDTCEKYSLKDVIKIIKYSLLYDKEYNENNSFYIYILIYDYIKKLNYTNINEYDKIYYDYIINDNVTIKDLITLFKNDDEFSNFVIKDFINRYSFNEVNKPRNYSHNKKLSKKFLPIMVMDYIYETQ